MEKTFIMALIIDVSERKKAEEELIHWANIFNESLNEIYIIDADYTSSLLTPIRVRKKILVITYPN